MSGGKGGGDVTIGYKYYLGIHFCLAHGQLDALTHITVDERIVWSGSISDGSLTISQENIFGGEKSEGGIAGKVDFQPGSPTQGQNNYLRYTLGTVITAAYTPPPDGSTITYKINGYTQTVVSGGVSTTTDVDNNKTTVTVVQTDGSKQITETLTGVGGQQTVTVTNIPAVVENVIADIPAYRRIASVILNQVYVGTNPYLKKWAFRVRRILKKSDGTAQWYSSKAAIGQDMNPAHIIRECITDTDWGMGYLDSDINEASFVAAADTLYSESFGMSLLWDRQATIDDFITEVLRHIDATLYVDRTTGQFTLKLIRYDYNPNTLPVLNEDIIMRVEDYKSTTFTELSNSVTVNFWNASTGNSDSLTVQDIAMVQVQGATLSTTVEYGGCTTGALAARLASRDLRALSTPMISCTVVCTRAASQYQVGTPLKLYWPDYGTNNVIMRVVAVDYGSATDNTVKLTLLQDVFSIGSATYAPPAPTEWQAIVNDPQPATTRTHIEAPYYQLAIAKGQSTIDSALSTNPDLGYIFVAAARPTKDTLSAAVWTNDGAGYAAESHLDFCAVGVSSGVIGKNDTTIPLASTTDFYADMIKVGTFALLNNEIVEVVNYTATGVSVRRGALDTVPVEHAGGSKIFLCARYHANGSTEYIYNEGVSIKILPTTGKGTLAIGSAPVSSVTMNRRAIRPYPPGNFQIAGQYFPYKLLDTPLSISWAHRNRKTQTGATLLTFKDASVTPEAGTTYSVRLYNDTTGALLHSVDGLTGSTYSSFPTMTGIYTLRIELWSKRDTYESLQKQSHIFIYENIYRLTLEAGTDHLLTEDDNTLITE